MATLEELFRPSDTPQESDWFILNENGQRERPMTEEEVADVKKMLEKEQQGTGLPHDQGLPRDQGFPSPLEKAMPHGDLSDHEDTPSSVAPVPADTDEFQVIFISYDPILVLSSLQRFK